MAPGPCQGTAGIRLSAGAPYPDKAGSRGVPPGAGRVLNADRW
jgi:hypothetical protein